MILAADILGSYYRDIKSIVVRTDFDHGTSESFSAAGIEPPISEAKFNDDLCFSIIKLTGTKLAF